MAHIGLIGLAVMGQNLARNIARNGFPIAVYNRTRDRTDIFVRDYGNTAISHAYTVEEFVASLERPRRIILMVKAGAAVEALAQQLRPVLESGDVLIDGGNSLFSDTERVARDLNQSGIFFLGTGISGGEEGALWGPSIMPGGPREAYEAVAQIFQAIAAKTPDGEPCVTYLGPGGAGHYVKMVHNGIEYAIMQAIAEVYDLLKDVGGLSASDLAALFTEWNRGELASFLVEITAHIFQVMDAESGRPLVDQILDQAQQKGTGKWTSQNALDLGVAVPAITAAVDARMLSALKAERGAGAPLLAGPTASKSDSANLPAAARSALYATMIVTYAQGFAQLATASRDYGYNYNLGEVAKIWRAGCIIRASLLEEIRMAYDTQPDLPNLLIADNLRSRLGDCQAGWRHTIQQGISNGIPMPVISAALAYYDSYRRERLPANLIQAQRDYFGAHTYQRLDQPGSFHTDWPRALAKQ
jgi:6-phosphogluconate dehydrogenase